MICDLCGVEAIAVANLSVADAYPSEALNVVPNGRFFIQGGAILLHHECSADPDWWWPGRSWWACQCVDRELDVDAHFDLYCGDCAARWSATQQDAQEELQLAVIRRKQDTEARLRAER